MSELQCENCGTTLPFGYTHQCPVELGQLRDDLAQARARIGELEYKNLLQRETVKNWEARGEAAESRAARYREALEWYRCRPIYENVSKVGTPLYEECADMADEALKEDAK